MATIIDDSDLQAQTRLFDFEVLHAPIELEEATESEAYDFLMWYHYHNRDKAAALWSRFQADLSRGRGAS